MSFADNLKESLSAKHLLKHPYYQQWNAGELPLDSLKAYARQYYHHVKAFPRYISATHSNCEDIAARQVLLENLNEEEGGKKHHPGLWRNFATGLGQSGQDVEAEVPAEYTRKLVDTFMQASRSSYEEGLGALYAYENQVPEVARTKIDGLKKFYGVDDENSLEFFQVHLEADVHHTKACADLLDGLSPEQQTRAWAAAERAAGALWGFLDGICEDTLAV